jgi:hypothetical protein
VPSGANGGFDSALNCSGQPGQAAARRHLLREAPVRRRTDWRRRFGHAPWMTPQIGINAIRDQPGADERGEYMLDGYRVSFLHQAEWQCACVVFCTAGACRHTRQAGGMRDAQARIARHLAQGKSDLLPARGDEAIRLTASSPGMTGRTPPERMRPVTSSRPSLKTAALESW